MNDLRQITETDFVGWVVATAAMHGWTLAATAEARRANAGFPVFVAVRDGRMVVAQLKAEKGVATAAQERWLIELAKVGEASSGAVVVHLWRPSDRDEIQAVLS